MAQSTASRPVSPVAMWVRTSQEPSPRFASMFATAHWEPKASATSEMSSGRSTAGDVRHTLSAPALSAARASSSVRIPPPMTRGTKTSEAVAAATSRIVLRPSVDAAMSRKTISSMPSAS